jgi:hypothetical protein
MVFEQVALQDDSLRRAKAVVQPQDLTANIGSRGRPFRRQLYDLVIYHRP